MLLIGIWVAGSVFVSVVASENFYTIDRLLAGSDSRAFQATADHLGRPQAREMLRYLSSELNRLYLLLWNVAQLALGAAALWTIRRVPSASRARWGVACMLVVVALMSAWLAPEITAVGRSLDFVPRDPPPPALGRFSILHATYTALELAKFAAGLVVAVWLGRIPGPPMTDRASSSI